MAVRAMSVSEWTQPRCELTVRVEGDKITITFPEPTPSLNPLHGAHWSRIVRERRKWRGYAAEAALQLRSHPPCTYPVLPLKRAVVSLTRYGARALDYDGLVGGAKAAIDSLVRAGFLAGDSPAHIGNPVYHQEVGSDRKTIITLESL